MKYRDSAYMNWLLLAGLLLAFYAQAETKATDDPTILQSDSFLDGHPDIKYRNLGVQRYLKGEYAEAIEHFKRAAFYADKPAQAMIGEMYWKGEGVAPNKALAYVWLDLAAERQYPSLLLIRERYWNGLDTIQQAQALALGTALYEKYGDAVAKKRLDAKLRAERLKVTGSRTGFVGALTIYLSGPDGESIPVDGSQYYQEKYWKSDEYWRWQDTVWKLPRKGKVSTSDLMPVKPENEPK